MPLAPPPLSTQSDTLAPAEICGRNGVYQYWTLCRGHDNGLRRIGRAVTEAAKLAAAVRTESNKELIVSLLCGKSK